jgi:uncharacterized protein YjiS (DUF1127 family)
MTTIGRRMPLAMLLGDIGTRHIPDAIRRSATAILRGTTRKRRVHELSDWILNDIGLERQDAMSADARRTMHRLNGLAPW